MKREFQEWADRIADADPHQGGRELRERMAEAMRAGLSAEDVEHVSGWPAAVVRAIVADLRNEGEECKLCGDAVQYLATDGTCDGCNEEAASEAGDPGKGGGETVTEWGVRWVFDGGQDRTACPDEASARRWARTLTGAGDHVSAVQVVRRTVTRSEWVEG